MLSVIFIAHQFIKFTMRIMITKTAKQNTAVISGVSLLILTVIFSDEVRRSASAAISNCLDVIIPCIFPVTVIAFLLLETGFPVKVKYITDRPLRRLCGLSGNCLEGVLLGLSGGYNTAVKCAVRLKENNLITETEAGRLALFFTNPGVSFTVMLAGAALTGSVRKGLMLYAETVFFNVLTAYLYNKKHNNTRHIDIRVKNRPLGAALVSAVDSASSVALSISFNIIFFSCITGISEELLPFTAVNELLKLTGEVSSAVIYSNGKYPFFITAGALTFGGICIFIQNLGDLKKLGIKPREFLLLRIFYALTVAVTEYILTIVFPESIYTGVIYPVKFTASKNITGSPALIFLCAVYLISVRSIKSGKIMTKKVH